ncbi:hypothetical protein TWF694_008817 [Orbilia ellipsospora]|uniref:BZIP domain-containing protein n=1 Tax=Orbilia ellipsospora TaxID=2528407 RepID=A0AAV9XFT3_9PEZI
MSQTHAIASGSNKKANAIRIRDNQRKSRAKHKEFVDSLQQRLREYETKGIQASAQMQQAARKVALENQRLRMLLQQNGVSPAEVDRFLSSFHDQTGLGAEARTPSDFVPKPQGCKRQIFSSDKAHEIRKQASPNRVCFNDEVASSGMDKRDSTKGCQSTIFGDASKTGCEGASIESSASPIDGSPAIDSNLETPCQTVANIMLQMRGDGDEQTVLSELSRLGCENPASCTMKNTKVFQILDEI